jgi:hypothetical protein
MRLAINRTCVLLAALVPFLPSPSTAQAQTSNSISAQTNPAAGHSEPLPPLLKPQPPAPEPTTPAARLFHDPNYAISFRIPTAWNLTRKDAEVSTFALDARTAPHTARLRAVVNITFNPYPHSTFSGALFYFSVIPHASPAQCAFQASARAPRTVGTTQVGGIPFTHGYDEHGAICVESRDEIYTTPHNGSCYRFDAVINTFCGGDVSGVKDITPAELNAVHGRMQTILDSVHFDQK